MKIAILGSAPSSLPLAPFNNSAYRTWVEGRVERLMKAHGTIPGDFAIWGCSPGCWAQIPRATTWFEVHRWQPGMAWFSTEYCEFLKNFTGVVYTGGKVPELPNHRVYPLDRMEEKFASYNMTSSIALMLALAIDVLEDTRTIRRTWDKSDTWARTPAGIRLAAINIDASEFEKPDEDDVIGLWGVDMAAAEEYAYQRPGCQNFVLEAMRRGIGVYLPPESDLMRPMPVYGISEWDHNYIKMTTRARELNLTLQEQSRMHEESGKKMLGIQGEIHALNHFVGTWTSPYGMLPGMVIRQTPGTGMGSGITHVDGRPIERMGTEEREKQAAVAYAMAESKDAQLGRELANVLSNHAGECGTSEGAIECLQRIIAERNAAVITAAWQTRKKRGARRARK